MNVAQKMKTLDGVKNHSKNAAGLKLKKAKAYNPVACNYFTKTVLLMAYNFGDIPESPKYI